ncbi:putative Ig domain-containing protein, partial [Massilia glaciei]
PLDPLPHAPHNGTGFSDPFARSDENDLARSGDDGIAPISLAIEGTLSGSPLGATIDAAVGRAIDGANESGAFRLYYDDAASAGSVVFTLPRNIFGGRELVSLRATLPGGQPLPLWLHFDAASRTFSGEAPVGALSFITIELVAVDTDGNELRATLTLGGEPAAAGPPPQKQSGLSGLDLLKALGLKGLERGDQALPEAPPRAADGPAPARHLSEQLQRQAQRFARGSDATMRHLEQIEQKNIVRPHA